MKAQRLRFRYILAVEATDLGQRDLVTAWEEACKAAALPLAYSEGKRPSPLLSIAAPLPQGVTSDCELMDLVLVDRVSAADTLARIAPQLPSGIRPTAVDEIGVNAPSLQSQVRWAEYEVRAQNLDHELVRESVCRILEATTLPAEYQRAAEAGFREAATTGILAGYPTVDLKLRNPYGFPIVLRAALDKGTLAFELRGRERPATVDLATATVGVAPFKRKVEEASWVKEGKYVLKQKGIRGYSIRKTRTIRLAGGEERVEVTTDVYPPTFEIYLVPPGTDVDAVLPPPLPPEDGRTASNEASPPDAPGPYDPGPGAPEGAARLAGSGGPGH